MSKFDYSLSTRPETPVLNWLYIQVMYIFTTEAGAFIDLPKVLDE